MSIFFNDSEEFVYVEVLFYVYKKEDEEVLMVFKTKEDASEKIQDKLQTLKAKFRRPNFYLHNEIIKACTSILSDGMPTLDFTAYKENILKKLLKQIDTGTIIQEINENNFGNLHPILGEFLFDAFNTKYLNPNIDLDTIINEKDDGKE